MKKETHSLSLYLLLTGKLLSSLPGFSLSFEGAGIYIYNNRRIWPLREKVNFKRLQANEILPENSLLWPEDSPISDA